MKELAVNFLFVQTKKTEHGAMAFDYEYIHTCGSSEIITVDALQSGGNTVSIYRK